MVAERSSASLNSLARRGAFVAAAAMLVLAPADPALAASRVLAEQMVDAANGGPNFPAAIHKLDGQLAQQMSATLGVVDAALQVKIAAAVRRRLNDAESGMRQTAVDAYAADFSDQELNANLAFAHSPAGQAEKANLPLLRQQLGGAFARVGFGPSTEESGAITRDDERTFNAAPAQTRKIVLRILKGQDVGARTRKSYELLVRTMDAVSQFARAAAGDQAPAAPGATKARVAGAEEDYVRSVLAAEKRFYVEHFTQAELTAMADYIESEPGQALLTRLPRVGVAVVGQMRTALRQAMADAESIACESTPCSDEQRARFDAVSRLMATLLSTTAEAFS